MTRKNARLATLRDEIEIRIEELREEIKEKLTEIRILKLALKQIEIELRALDNPSRLKGGRLERRGKQREN